MPSKYVILRTKEGERAILFPEDNFYHNDLADCFSALEVVAAGFVAIQSDGAINCFGKSESLDIGSRGQDDEIVIVQQFRSR